MNQKVTIVSLLIAIGIQFVSSIWAIPPPLKLPDQVDLNSIISGVQKKYSQMRALSADFVQVYQGSDGRTIRESGRLHLKRPGKARWDYFSPEKKVFVSDGKYIYFHVAGEKQATKTSIKDSGDPQIPFLFLLGRGDIRRDFSRIELLSDERAIESGNKVIRLVPKQAPPEFNRLLVEIYPVTYQVKRLVIIEKNGTRMDFLLNNVLENDSMPDQMFQFAAPAGVSIKQI